ncbi:hypothetical protein MNBD_PLANCTO02-2192, partial [hydrothermal vent metagenome]
RTGTVFGEEILEQGNFGTGWKCSREVAVVVLLGRAPTLPALFSLIPLFALICYHVKNDAVRFCPLFE